MDTELLQRLEAALAGSQRDLARLISAIENGSPGVFEVLDRVAALGSAGAHVLGVTGPPGAGKSTLVDGLLARMRAAGESVAVLLVDPSSPFTGGAVLGDRIRMQRHTADAGVFIRSLGSRGHQGGLTRSTEQVLQLVRAAGFDRVVMETVGVGQTELQVMDLADTVLVTLVPEAGDAIQAMKAGLMEIADLFAVNKSDRPGADRMVMELRQALHHAGGTAAAPDALPERWTVPVLSVAAAADRGVDELVASLEAHREHTARYPAPLRSPVERLAGLLDQGLRRRVRDGLEGPAQHGELAALMDGLVSGAVTPYRAASRILDEPTLLAALLGAQGGGDGDA